MNTLRRATALLLTGVVLCATGSASAQKYPVKAVHIVTGGVGTFHDIVARQLGQKLSERWGQPVVVENQ